MSHRHSSSIYHLRRDEARQRLQNKTPEQRARRLIYANHYGERFISLNAFAKSFGTLSSRTRKTQSDRAVENEILYWVEKGQLCPPLFEHTPREFEKGRKELREAGRRNDVVYFPDSWSSAWCDKHDLGNELREWQIRGRIKGPSPIELALARFPEFYCTLNSCQHNELDYLPRKPLFHYWQIHLLDAIRRENTITSDRNNRSHRIEFIDDLAGRRYSFSSNLILHYESQLEQLSRYANRVVFAEGGSDVEDLIHEHFDGVQSDVDKWLDLLRNMCNLWEAYTTQSQHKLATYIRNDIVLLSDILSSGMETDYDKQCTFVGISCPRRVADDSLLDWVMDGDLYLARRDAIIILEMAVNSYNKLAGEASIAHDSVPQIVDFALESDCALLIHALSWHHNNGVERLGRHYYLSEAIRPLRETAISIETLLDVIMDQKSSTQRPRTEESFQELGNKLKWCFAKENPSTFWWNDYCSIKDAAFSGEKPSKEARVLEAITKIPELTQSLARAFATTHLIRNLTVHTAKHSKAIVNTSASEIWSDLNNALLYIWQWYKQEKPPQIHIVQ